MIKTYKILSLLLSYPTVELHDFLPEAEKVLAKEALLPKEKIADIIHFLHHFKGMNIVDWQAEYVQLFDYSRSASLHLFEHIKSDSKDRGQAMVDLLEFYNGHGLELSINELPDYLPVFLEFLSTLKADIAAELLAEPVQIIGRIHEALNEKKNMYRHVIIGHSLLVGQKG